MKQVNRLPIAVDFSTAAIGRAVFSDTAQKPYVTFGAAFGVLGTATGFLFPPLAPLAFAVGGAGLLVGVGGWIVNYFFRYDVHANDYLRRYSNLSQQRAEALAEELKGEFAELRFEQGIDQIDLLKKNLDAIAHVLEEKFDKDDTSYQQFFGPAEVLYMKSLNVLKDAAAQLRANQAYDPDYLKKVQKTNGKNQSLDRQRTLHDEGTTRFTTLIESVDTAITGLAELTHDVARISSATNETHDAYIQRVREVASRASLYVDEKAI